MKKTVCILMLLVLLIAVSQVNAERSDYYSVMTNEDFTYDYYVRDKNGNKLLSVEKSSRCPQIEMIGENIVSVLLQSGIGRSTNVVRYYNIENGAATDAYKYVLGHVDDKVVYVDFDTNHGYSVVVSEIFDKKEQIIRVPLENVHTTDPIVSETISEDVIEIVYLEGEWFVETKIKINLAERSYVHEIIGSEDKIAEELFMKTEKAYAEESCKADFQTTAGMIELNRKYADKWKSIADEYYNKIITLRDGIHTEEMAKMKENWEVYFKNEIDSYSEILNNCFSGGSIYGPMLSSYICDTNKELARKMIDIYLVASMADL